MISILRELLDLLFPPLCHLCKTFIPACGMVHLCADCAGTIVPVSSPACTVCGVPFHVDEGIDHKCGNCIVNPKPFHSARGAVHFQGAARQLIHRLKYGHKVHLARPLGLLTAESLSRFAAENSADLIIPVPLHPRRLRQRGFNQAALLAHILGKKWQIPLSVNNFRRIRWTEPQICLSVEERIKNVRGAFEVKEPSLVKGKRILLCDDVYTTGSTVSECAKVLKQAGADEVFVVTVARAVME